MRKAIYAIVSVLIVLVAGVPARVGAVQAAAPNLLLVRKTQRFDVYRAYGGLSRAEALQLSARFESTMDAVARRFGTPFTARERIYLLPPQRGVCAVRGLTSSALRQIRLYYAPGTEIDRIQSLVAHEFVHQLQRERFGDAVQRKADIILLEGWATLASDEFARTPDGREARWRDRLRGVVARGELLPLTVDLNRDCRTTTRNSLYDQWASFVDFLQRKGGTDKLAALYRGSVGRKAGTANYKAVYGQTFAELEAEWRTWVVSQ